MKLSHTNFKLNNGTYSVSENMPEFHKSDPTFLGIKEFLNIDGNIPESWTFADYGCYEGGYSIALAKLGLNGVGYDARKENIERCKFLASGLNIPVSQLQFKIRDLQTEYNNSLEKLDFSFCLGLLYHLEKPHEFIKHLGNTTKRILFLHTHYASNNKPYQAEKLGDYTTHEGLKGRWYTEHPENVTNEQIEGSRKSSYGNKKSFWIDKNHLIWALKNAGFKLILEQHDWIHDTRTNDYVSKLDRNMFVCIK